MNQLNGRIMEELQKYQLINECETVMGLEKAIMIIADEDGEINGRSRKFDAEKMRDRVRGVVRGEIHPNYLTRSYGIRQQALYLKEYIDLETYTR